jgi:hypothetical protein
MKRYFLLLLTLMIGYNVFLIHRDKQLFDAYNATPTRITSN